MIVKLCDSAYDYWSRRGGLPDRLFKCGFCGRYHSGVIG